jgi:hypothetical protein
MTTMVDPAERERTLDGLRQRPEALPCRSGASTVRCRRSTGKARPPDCRRRKRRLGERFFVPPYVGHRGWLGVRLDRGLGWNEVAGIAEDAYAEVAPAKLVQAARTGDQGAAP